MAVDGLGDGVRILAFALQDGDKFFHNTLVAAGVARAAGLDGVYRSGARSHARAELRHLNDVVVHGSANLAPGAHKFDGAVACVGKRAHRERHGGAVFKQEAGHLMIHHIVVVVEHALAVGAFLQRLLRAS